MYVSVKPVNFTDDELEIIFNDINLCYIDLCKRFFPEADPDQSSEILMEHYDSILNKIEDSGMFD